MVFSWNDNWVKNLNRINIFKTQDEMIRSCQALPLAAEERKYMINISQLQRYYINDVIRLQILLAILNVLSISHLTDDPKGIGSNLVRPM